MRMRAADCIERGLTLIEIVVAIGSATVIALGVMGLGAAGLRMRRAVHTPSTVTDFDQSQVAMAAIHLTKTMELADRFVLKGSPTFKSFFRIPIGCLAATPAPDCFDQTEHYEWRRYQLISSSLEYRVAKFAPATSSWECGANTVLSHELGGPNEFRVTQRNEDGLPGGDPNVLEYVLHWVRSGGGDRYFRGEVTLRSAADWGTTASGLSRDVTALPPLIGNDPSTFGGPLNLFGAPACLDSST